MAKKKNKQEKISEALAITCLILNILTIPGLGSLIGGKTKEGIWQLILVLGSSFIGVLLTITIIGAIVGIPILIIGVVSAWIWGVVTGIRLVRESEK